MKYNADVRGMNPQLTKNLRDIERALAALERPSASTTTTPNGVSIPGTSTFLRLDGSNSPVTGPVYWDFSANRSVTINDFQVNLKSSYSTVLHEAQLESKSEGSEGSDAGARLRLYAEDINLGTTTEALVEVLNGGDYPRLKHTRDGGSSVLNEWPTETGRLATEEWSRSRLRVLHGVPMGYGTNRESTWVSSVSRDHATRTWTFSGDVYIEGVKHTFTNATVVWPTGTSMKYLYITPNGTLTASDTPWNIFSDILIEAYFYDSASEANSDPLEERHGADRDRAWHYTQHFAADGGTRLDSIDRPVMSGLTEGGATPVGPTDNGNRGSWTAHDIFDEDIRFRVSANAENSYTHLYYTGSKPLHSFNNLNMVSVGATYAMYNNLGSGLTESSSGRYVVVFFASKLSKKGGAYQNVIIPAQTDFASYNEALAYYPSSMNLTWLPTPEFVFWGRAVYRCFVSYTTAGKIGLCKFDYIYQARNVSSTGGSGGTTDHNLLTNRDIANQHPFSAITSLVRLQDGWADLSPNAGTYAVIRHQNNTDGFATGCVWVDSSGRAVMNASSGQTATLRVANTTILSASGTGVAVTGDLSCTGNTTRGDAGTDTHTTNGVDYYALGPTDYITNLGQPAIYATSVGTFAVNGDIVIQPRTSTAARSIRFAGALTNGGAVTDHMVITGGASAQVRVFRDFYADASVTLGDTSSDTLTVNATANFQAQLEANKSHANSNGGTGVLVKSALPNIRWYETDAASDEKIWDFRADTGDLYLITRNDADTSGVDIFKVTRGTGTAVASFNFFEPVLTTKGFGSSSIYAITMSSNAGTWDLNQGFTAYPSATFSGNATITLTNPQIADCRLLVTQDATPRDVTISCTGVNFALYGTATVGTNSITIPASQFATGSARYIIDLIFYLTTGCAISVRK